MSEQSKEKYPAGWDEARIRRLAEHYDNQSEEEQTAEIEAACAAEEKFKQRLMELGLLTRITPPLASAVPGDRQPVPVTGNAVSETVVEDRR